MGLAVSFFFLYSFFFYAKLFGGLNLALALQNLEKGASLAEKMSVSPSGI